MRKFSLVFLLLLTLSFAACGDATVAPAKTNPNRTTWSSENNSSSSSSSSGSGSSTQKSQPSEQCKEQARQAYKDQLNSYNATGRGGMAAESAASETYLKVLNSCTR